MSHCENKKAAERILSKWKDLGATKLSWIALNAQVPLDIDDDEHVLEDEKLDVNGNRFIRILKKDGSEPALFLYRGICKDGQIGEGQASSTKNAFLRIIEPDLTVQVGFWKGVKKNGHLITYEPDGSIRKGVYLGGDFVEEDSEINF